MQGCFSAPVRIHTQSGMPPVTSVSFPMRCVYKTCFSASAQTGCSIGSENEITGGNYHRWHVAGMSPARRRSRGCGCTSETSCNVCRPTAPSAGPFRTRLRTCFVNVRTLVVSPFVLTWTEHSGPRSIMRQALIGSFPMCSYLSVCLEGHNKPEICACKRPLHMISLSL